MKRFKTDPAMMKRSTYLLAVIIAAVTYYKFISNMDIVFAAIGGVFGRIVTIITPFLYGFLIAFIINPIARRLELVFKKIGFFAKHNKAARMLSASICFVSIIGIIVWMISFLVPDVIRSITDVFTSVTKIAQNPDTELFGDVIDRVNAFTGQNYTLGELVNNAVAPLIEAVGDLPEVGKQVLSGAMSVAGTALDIVLGVIIAFYMTLEKDRFASAFRRLLKLIFKEKTAMKIIDIAKDSNNMFEKFFTGKLLDSLVIGLIFYIVAEYILKLNYALFFSIIIGVTNMIPYFGPFIGGIPVALIVFIGDTRLGLWTGLVILILQQFDGNILGPLILGDSTGVRPLEVIFAIIVGGATFGVLGMFFGVPVYAVIKTAVIGFINKRIDDKEKQEKEKTVTNSA